MRAENGQGISIPWSRVRSACALHAGSHFNSLGASSTSKRATFGQTSSFQFAGTRSNLHTGDVRSSHFNSLEPCSTCIRVTCGQVISIRGLPVQPADGQHAVSHFNSQMTSSRNMRSSCGGSFQFLGAPLGLRSVRHNNSLESCSIPRRSIISIRCSSARSTCGHRSGSS